jgi:hypothetical protein
MGLLRNCEIRYVTRGIYADRVSPTIDSCVLRDFSQTGCYVDGSDSNPKLPFVISDCLIRQYHPAARGVGDGIRAYRATDISISGATIMDCNYGILFQSSGSLTPHFSIAGCDIRRNSRGIYSLPSG